VKKASEGEDVTAIKSATEALGQAVQKIGASVYQSGQNMPGSDGATGTDTNPNPEAGPDVVEGEVKE
jgi:molecular chaperone DnaK